MEGWKLTNLKDRISRLLKGGSAEPQVKFKAQDQNVTAGQTTHYTFDADPVGGVPKGAAV